MSMSDHDRQEAAIHRADQAVSGGEAGQLEARSAGARADTAQWLDEDADRIVPAAGDHAGAGRSGRPDASLELSMSLSSEHLAARAPDRPAEEHARELYHSPNGDRWLLIRDAASVRVRHVANPASGGHTSETDVGGFLRQDGCGPEKQELLRLIGELAS